MSDDENDIRLLLTGVLAGSEPEHRDLAGPAVSIVVNGRRRMRILTYTGSAVALVAVAGAIAVGLDRSPGTQPGHESPASTATNSSTGNPTQAGQSAPDASSRWDKQRDIRDRLPSLLNKALPHGYSLGAVDGELSGPAFLLTGPTGTNTISMTAKKASTIQKYDLYGPDNCVASGGRCSSHKVPGGMLYLQLKDFPADYGGADGFKPGTEKTVLSFEDDYLFVPDDPSAYAYSIRMTAGENHPQYADKPPKDWTGGAWPPTVPIGNVEDAFNSGGALLSQDQYVAMAGSPAMAAVGALLDPATPAAQSAKDEHAHNDAAIQAATKGLLPDGLVLTLNGASPGLGADLILTGPSGTNSFTWTADKQQANWKHGGACQSHTEQNCTATDVPGGELAVNTQPVVTSGTDPDADQFQPGTDRQTAYMQVEYQYYPDDPNGTVVTLNLRAQTKDIPWAATAPPSWQGTAWPPPARDGGPFNAGGALLTPDQFVKLATSPDVMKTVTTVNQLSQ